MGGSAELDGLGEREFGEVENGPRPEAFVARLDIRGEALDPAVALRPGIAMVVVTVQEQPRFEGAHCPRDDAAIAGACRREFGAGVALDPGRDRWCVWVTRTSIWPPARRTRVSRSVLVVRSVAHHDRPSVRSWRSVDTAPPSAPNGTPAHSHTAPRSAHSTTPGRSTRSPNGRLSVVRVACKWVGVVVTVDEPDRHPMHLRGACHRRYPAFVKLWVGPTAPTPQVGPQPEVAQLEHPVAPVPARQPAEGGDP